MYRPSLHRRAFHATCCVWHVSLSSVLHVQHDIWRSGTACTPVIALIPTAYAQVIRTAHEAVCSLR